MRNTKPRSARARKAPESTLEAKIAALHAQVHLHVAKLNSTSLAAAGRLQADLLGHTEATSEVLVLVLSNGSYAFQAITQLDPKSAPHEHLHGLQADELQLLAEKVASAVIHSPGVFLKPAVTTRPVGFTDAERAALAEGGVDLTATPLDDLGAAKRGELEYNSLRDDSYTVDDAARLLGVNSSRIRQRLTARPPTLFGIKEGRSWRLPRFQFSGRRLVPGIHTVISKLAADLSPVAIYRWFTTANPDLEADNQPVSPLAWLKSGHSPNQAAELAACL